MGYIKEEHKPENSDPNNEFLHKVRSATMDLYIYGKVTTVRAECGKIWSPELPTDTSKPKCTTCFPVQTYHYAVAA